MTAQHGWGRWQQPQPCEACAGTGFYARGHGNGRYQVRGQDVWRDCDDCAGSGECPECDGTGRLTPDDGGWVDER